MPKKDIDYSKALIYKLVCNDLEIKECYVGSTTDFTNRKWDHKTRCTNENGHGYNYRVYQFIRNNGGFDNWTMVQVESYPCETVLELRARERHWIEQLQATLNCKIPTHTKQEYAAENKE